MLPRWHCYVSLSAEWGGDICVCIHHPVHTSLLQIFLHVNICIYIKLHIYSYWYLQQHHLMTHCSLLPCLFLVSNFATQSLALTVFHSYTCSILKVFLYDKGKNLTNSNSHWAQFPLPLVSEPPLPSKCFLGSHFPLHPIQWDCFIHL